MAILVDFNQVVISALTSAEFGGGAKTFDPGYVKHMTLNILRSYKVKYGREFGEIVICCDSGNYWRKDIFPYYKANRKKDRDSSDFDWETIFRCMDEVRTDITEYFPYPVIRVDRCEGDDIIATLCEYFQTNELQDDGMWHGEPKPVLILSTDGDLVQNQRYSNVKQYSPKFKKFLRPEGMTVAQYIAEHIAEGDSGDGIPNTLSADNCLVDKIRQKSLTKALRADFIERGINACRDDNERAYYQRNQQIIDFAFIPQYIKDAIIAEYQEQKAKCDMRGRKRIMSYLIKNKMSLLIEHLNEF